MTVLDFLNLINDRKIRLDYKDVFAHNIGTFLPTENELLYGDMLTSFEIDYGVIQDYVDQASHLKTDGEIYVGFNDVIFQEKDDENTQPNDLPLVLPEYGQPTSFFSDSVLKGHNQRLLELLLLKFNIKKGFSESIEEFFAALRREENWVVSKGLINVLTLQIPVSWSTHSYLAGHKLDLVQVRELYPIVFDSDVDLLRDDYRKYFSPKNKIVPVEIDSGPDIDWTPQFSSVSWLSRSSEEGKSLIIDHHAIIIKYAFRKLFTKLREVLAGSEVTTFSFSDVNVRNSIITKPVSQVTKHLTEFTALLADILEIFNELYIGFNEAINAKKLLNVERHRKFIIDKDLEKRLERIIEMFDKADSEAGKLIAKGFQFVLNFIMIFMESENFAGSESDWLDKLTNTFYKLSDNLGSSGVVMFSSANEESLDYVSDVKDAESDKERKLIVYRKQMTWVEAVDSTGFVNTTVHIGRLFDDDRDKELELELFTGKSRNALRDRVRREAEGGLQAALSLKHKAAYLITDAAIEHLKIQESEETGNVTAMRPNIESWSDYYISLEPVIVFHFIRDGVHQYHVIRLNSKQVSNDNVWMLNAFEIHFDRSWTADADEVMKEITDLLRHEQGATSDEDVAYSDFIAKEGKMYLLANRNIKFSFKRRNRNRARMIDEFVNQNNLVTLRDINNIKFSINLILNNIQ